MRVAILITDTLPVPAVKGGAVQTGVQQLIDENEKHGQIDLIVLSPFDLEAKKASVNYKNATFYYLPTSNKLVKSIIKIINKFINFFGLSNVIDENPKYSKAAYEIIKDNNIEKVLLKNAYKFVRSLSSLSNLEIYLQLHNDYLNEDSQDNHYIYSNSTKIITCSNYIKNRVLTIKNTSGNKIYVNKNCTDLKLFSQYFSEKEKNELRQQLNISLEDKIVLFVGRTVKNKGIEELLESFKMLLKKDRNYKLLIVGNKNFGKNSFDFYKKKLVKISNGLEEKIIFTGYIPYSQLPLIHSISHVAVVPSIWEEPAGRVVIEAQASGLPSVVSDSGGIPEYTVAGSSIVVKRDSSFIENMANEIDLILNDSLLYKEMCEAGKKNSLNYSSKKYYDELLDFLEIERKIYSD